jgi:hypothetical protein
MPAETYAEVVTRTARERAQARLHDPAEHFPYKHKTVTKLLADGVPLGPGVPGETDGGGDDSRTIDDYMSRGIADASRDYIAAQAAWLKDPSDDTAGQYEAARDRLIAARLDHRQNRDAGFVVGAAARKGR